MDRRSRYGYRRIRDGRVGLRQHKIGKSYFGNCWLVALKLVVTGRAKAVWIRWGTRCRPHPLVLTRKGNFVHFSSDKTRDLWICVKGRVHVLRHELLRDQRYWRLPRSNS